MLYPLTGVLLGWLVLRWPRSGLQNHAQLWLLRIAFILIPLLTAASDVTWDPRWGGYTGGIWWPTLVRHKEPGTWLYNVTQDVEGINPRPPARAAVLADEPS
jgi:hypothetical protein